MGSGAADRTVLFKLKLVPDDSSPEALRKFAADIKAAQKEAYSGGRGASAAKAQNEQHKRMADILRQQEREAVLADRMQAQRVREQNKRTIDSLRQQDREAGQQQRAAERAAREQEKAGQRMREANLRLGESFKGSLEGITSLARGFAMLGLLGEKNTAKLLEGLVQIEGMAAMARGGISLWTGGSKMLNTARATVAAAGAAGTVAPFGAKAVVAGGAALPWLAAAGGIAAGGTAAYQTGRDIRKYGFLGGATPGSFTEMIASKEAGTLAWMQQKLGRWATGPIADMIVGGLGRSNVATERIQKIRDDAKAAQLKAYHETAPGVAAKLQEEEVYRAARYQNVESVARERALSGMHYRNPEEQAMHEARLSKEKFRSAIAAETPAFNAAKAEYQRLSAMPPAVVNPASLMKAQESYAKELEAMQRYYAGLGESTKALADAQRLAKQRTEEAAEAHAKSYRNQRQGIWNEMRSDAQRLGAASPGDRMRATQAIERFERGGQLTPDMEGMVEQYGTKYQRERLRKQQEQRGESIMRERGWTAPYEEQAASAGRMAEQHEARAEKAAKLKVEIMANEEQEAQLVEAAMKTFFDAMVPRIKEAASKAYQEQIGLAIEKIRTAAQINELVNSSSG